MVIFDKLRFYNIELLSLYSNFTLYFLRVLLYMLFFIPKRLWVLKHFWSPKSSLLFLFPVAMDPNLRGVVFIVYFKQFYVFENIWKSC